MATFYVVATPIGNLEDITLRALRVLKEVDLILCEDTRRTQKLLNYYKIKTKTLSYHQHSNLKRTKEILNFLKRGKNLALVSDAGTPGLSDPGGKLIEKIGETFGSLVKIVPLPGPSALIAGASISGFPMDKFLFLGFPPLKKKRKKFFEKIAKFDFSVIFYESPYRIIKTLKELKNYIKKRKVVVSRELTKKFESVYRGEIEKVIKEIEGDEIRGEFVIVVSPSKF